MRTRELTRAKISYLGALGIVGALSLMASEARATILLATTNGTEQRSPPLASNDFLDLGGGQTVLFFSTPAPNTRVVITFNAECTVLGPSGAWIEDDILIDSLGINPGPDTIVVPPSDSDNALCSGNETGSWDGSVSASTQATAIIPTAGAHNIQILVTGHGTDVLEPPPWQIDDLSLVIETE